MKQFCIILLLIAPAFALKTLTSSVAFTDAQGNALASGYLVFQLSAPARFIVGGQVVPVTPIKITLGAGGLVNASQQLAANDELQPTGTYYIVRVFNSNDEQVRGPENWIISGASPIDLALITNANLPDPGLANAVLQNPSAAQSITGFGLTLTTSAPLTLASLNKIQFADQQAGATADVQINNCVAALPASGGTCDARGYGATSQTIAATVTVGGINKTVTLLLDRTTKFTCTITNTTPCVQVDGGSSIIAMGPTAYPNAGIVAGGSATVSNVLLVTNKPGTNQAGAYIEGLSVGAPTGATVTDAICGDQDTLQLTTWLNVTCASNGAQNTIGLKVYADGASASIANAIFQNIQVDGQGNTGFKPIWIGCAASGSTTLIACGQIGSVNFIGGIGVHPGTGGLAIVDIEAGNGAGGTNAISNITFSGYQIESSNTADIGILDNGAEALHVYGFEATCHTNCGTSVFQIAQPAGTTTDGVDIRGVDNQGLWTNAVNNTINSLSFAAGRFNYTYGKGAGTKQSVWEDSANREVIIDQNGLTIRGGSAITSSGAGGTMAAVIGSGTAAMTTASITSLACGTTVTVATANVATTDSIEWAFNAAPAANPGELVVSAWPTSGNVNFQYCNPTAGSVTPNAATLNFRVIR